MSASIFSFTHRRGRSRQHDIPVDWSTQELAELYRICERLGQAGLKVSIYRGLTDEGDPWAIFERDETSEVIVHIGRVDGLITVINIATGQVYRNVDFRAITNQMLRNESLSALRHSDDDKVVVHPKSVFTAFVAAAILVTEFTRNIESAHAEQKVDEVVPDETHNSLSHLMLRLFTRDHTLVVQNINNPMAAVGMFSAAVVAMDLVVENWTPDSIHDDDSRVLEQTYIASKALSGRYSEPAVADKHSDNLHSISGESIFAGTVIDQREEANFQPHMISVDATLPSKTPAEATKTDLAFQGKDVENYHEYSIPLEAMPGNIERSVSEQQKNVQPQEAPPASEEVVSNGSAADANATPFSQGHLSRSLSAISLLMPKQLNESVTVAVTDLNEISDNTSLKQALTMFFDDKLESRTNVSFPGQSLGSDINSGENSDTDSNNAHDVPKSNPRFAFHDVGGQNGIAVLSDDEVDVVIYQGGDASFSHFELGKDLILVDGSFSHTDWITQIEVEGSDILIVGVDGGTISMYDSYHHVA